MTHSIDTAAYWTRREANINADIAEQNAFAGSIEGKIEAVERHIRLMDADASAYTVADRAAAQSALTALKAQAAAEYADAFATEWTLAVTAARRAAWNTFAKTVPTAPAARRIAVAKQVAAQGWTVENLKSAVALHNL